MSSIAADPAALAANLFYEVFRGLGVLNRPWHMRVLKPLLGPPIRLLVRQSSHFDEDARQFGLSGAARRFLPRFMRGWQVQGAEKLPTSGPLLLVSNHPGTLDALLIAAALPRDDLRFIARDMQFLRNLPAVHPHMIYSTLDTHVRMLVVRGVMRQLTEGRSVLIFPTGKLDPDPAVLPGASQALEEWSASLNVILRRLPETQVVPVIVSGLLSRRLFPSSHHPKRTLPREKQIRREILQVVLQILFPRAFDMCPAVSFASPLSAGDLLGMESPRDAIVRCAQELLHSQFPRLRPVSQAPELRPLAERR